MCVPMRKRFDLCGHYSEEQINRCPTPTDSCLMRPMIKTCDNELCPSCTLLPNPTLSLRKPPSPFYFCSDDWPSFQHLIDEFSIESNDLDAFTAGVDFTNIWVNRDFRNHIIYPYFGLRNKFWRTWYTEHVMEHRLRITMLQIRNYIDAVKMHAAARQYENDERERIERQNRRARRRKLERQRQSEREINRVLRPVDISSLPADNRDCSICKVPYGETDGNIPAENPVEVPCNAVIKHVFGNSCILHWLRDNSTCPLDRTHITMPAV